MDYENLKQLFCKYLTDNNFSDTDIAVHCDTQEKAEILINVFALLGKAWSANAPLLLVNENNRAVTRWNKEKTDTCYRISETEPRFVVKGNISFYQNRNNVTVIEFNDLFPSILDKLKETSVVMQETEKPKKKFGLFSSKKEDNPLADTDKAEEILNNQGYKVESFDLTKETDSNTFNPNPIHSDVENDVDLENDDKNVKTEVNKILDESNVVSDKKTNFKITDIIPEFTSFYVDGMDNRKFMFNDLGIREEEKMPDFWVKCDCEWELSYILMNLDKVHLIE